MQLSDVSYNTFCTRSHPVLGSHLAELTEPHYLPKISNSIDQTGNGMMYNSYTWCKNKQAEAEMSFQIVPIDTNER